MKKIGKQPVQVFSEIGRLKQVIVHRPGRELLNLIPDYLDRLLFDDIPYLAEAQNEHDAFVKILEENDVEVLYLERLVAEAIEDSEIKEKFIDQWLAESGLMEGILYDKVRADLLSYEDTFEMVLKTMEGYRKSEIDIAEGEQSLFSLKDSDYPFLIDPMPNLYFTRDPFATIGQGVSLNRMYSDTRNRETIYGKYIFEHHPILGGNRVKKYYDRDYKTPIEGGDELILNEKTLVVGISQRTDARAIEVLARNLFEETAFEEVLAFLIEDNRKFMHLDTVFTMVDHDAFTIHPEIEEDLKVFSLTKNEDKINITEKVDDLENILADTLDLESVRLIRGGGGDLVTAASEQWNDGSNTLAIAPGEVIVYDRNPVTNQLLREAGITVHEFSGGELVRGRGGTRCMSMPVYREPVD